MIYLFNLELIHYLLRRDKFSKSDENSIVNGILFSYRLKKSFVLFLNNPEDEKSIWKDFLLDYQMISIEKANQGLFSSFVYH